MANTESDSYQIANSRGKELVIKLLKEQLNEARAASEAKSLFIANMSHELRTPMNAILGYAQIMESEVNLPPELQTAVSTISSASEHLLSLVDDILDLSKIEAGKMEVDAQSFELDHLLDTVSNMMEIKCKEKHLKWNFINQQSSEDGAVVGDALKIRQILFNLLGNAVKFTNEGQVTLSVEKKAEDSYWFHIIDTGPGISIADQETIFDAYTQEDSGKKNGGTGLGLSITTRQIELMGGGLMMTSQLGEGSHFSFVLNLPTAIAEVKTKHDQVNRVKCLKQGYQAKVLVVDDVQVNRDILKRVLEKIGVQVCVAESGTEAISKVTSEQPDLVFLDLHLPDMTGFEVIKKLRKFKSDADLPIVAFSASNLTKDRIQCKEAGFNDFLSKPFRFPNVYQILEKFSDLEFEYH